MISQAKMSAVKLAFVGIFIATAGVFLFGVGGAHASPYGTEITKKDGIAPDGSGIAGEDNEVEPGMVQSQAWDLEGFFLDGMNLTIVGGYNFYTGYENMYAGDIFIDTDGDAIYSPNTIPGFDYNPGGKTVKNGFFHYDYVLDVDWAGGTYDIVTLNFESILKDTVYGNSHNKPSNPWIYVEGGDITETRNIVTYEKTSKIDTGLLGWGADNNHFVATFDLTGIDLSKGAIFHNTMQCGNDNLIGEDGGGGGNPVPEPSTFVLLGAGLAGLVAWRRKRS